MSVSRLGVVDARLDHLEDGADQLGEEALVLFLVDLLLQRAFSVGVGGDAGDHHAAHLVDVVELGLEVVVADAREAEVVVGVRAQAALQVVDDLVDLDLDLLLGELVHLEALDHDVLEVRHLRLPQLRVEVFGAPRSGSESAMSVKVTSSSRVKSCRKMIWRMPSL